MEGIYPLTVTLTKEINRVMGRSYVYAYDKAGNITSKKQYAFTTGTLGTVQTTYNYAYNSTGGWGDLLTSFAGESITYDEIGNPTSIGSYVDFVWEGRKLVGYANGDTGVEVTYTYNDEGIRTSKDVGGVLHTYTLDGSTIVAEEFGNYLFVYLYDETGAPVGIQYRQKSDAAEVFSTYVFEKNLQGDIIAIYNESGTKIASYTYDAWGNFTLTYTSGISATDRVAATNNPFRYRGYYFDSETGLYYLQSRYYNPAWGRFISADSIAYLGITKDMKSYNLYAFCNNNPVMYMDPNGHFVISLTTIIIGIAIGAALGGTIGFGATVYEDYKDDGEVFNGSIGADEYIGNTIGGTIAGAGIGACGVLGAGLGSALIAGEALIVGGTAISGGTALGISFGSAFVSGGLGYTARTAINGKESFEWSDMFIEAGANAASGMISFIGGMCGGITGVKVPGTPTSMKNFAAYHAGMTWFGAYPIKGLISKIKGGMQEIY